MRLGKKLMVIAMAAIMMMAFMPSMAFASTGLTAQPTQEQLNNAKELQLDTETDVYPEVYKYVVQQSGNYGVSLTKLNMYGKVYFMGSNKKPQDITDLLYGGGNVDLNAGATVYFYAVNDGTHDGYAMMSMTINSTLTVNEELAQDYVTKSTLTTMKNGYKMKWEMATGYALDGFEIWRSAKRTSGFKMIKDTPNTSYVNKFKRNGKTYYYKIRAYKLVDGAKVYTKFYRL